MSKSSRERWLGSVGVVNADPIGFFAPEATSLRGAVDEAVTRHKATCVVQRFMWSVTTDDARWALTVGPAIERPTRARSVSAYARDLRANRWGVSDQGISFSANGERVNGCHRMHAILEAGVTMRNATIFVGVEQRYQDLGIPRGMGDRWRIDGVANSQKWSTAVRCALWCADGAAPTQPSYSALELDDARERFGDTIEALKERVGPTNLKRLTGSVVGPILWALHETGNLRLIDFAKRTAEGVMLERLSPEFALRHYLDRGGRREQHDVMLRALHAIAFALEERPVERLGSIHRIENLLASIRRFKAR